MSHRLRRSVGALLTAIVFAVAAMIAFPSAAHADPECQTGGAYVLFVRGSGEKIYDFRARAFWENVRPALNANGVGSVDWAELGNLDGARQPGDTVPYPTAGKYPAVPVDKWNIANVLSGNYTISVETGKNELIAHLNDRYAGDGPTGGGSCSNETLVLAGYSQGADVIGRTLNSGQLSQAVWNHIGFVALYGDPRFYPGSFTDRFTHSNFQTNWWWVRGDDPGYFVSPFYSDLGALGARIPYAPSQLKGRFGSWCAAFDTVCTGWALGMSIHSNAYQNYWIADSADEIAYEVKLKRDQLSAGNEQGSANPYVATPPATAQPQSYPQGVQIPPAPTYTHPTAISRNDRTMDVFYKSADGNLVARGWDVDLGWNYQWWPYNLDGNPVAVVRKAGAMDVFWRGSGGSLMNFGWDVDTGWHDPVQLVGSCVSGDPAVASRAEGSMDVLWRSCNNELKNVHWESTTGWGSVVTRIGSGNVYSNPTVTSRRSDLMDVFYKNASGGVTNLGWKSADGWYAPYNRCNNIAGNPVAVNRGLSAMSVYYRAANGDLAECGWTSTTNWNYQSWTVPMVGDPAAVVRDASHMSVFYHKSDGTLWERGWDANSGWALQGWDDHLTSDPVAVSHSTSTMDVFFRAGSGDVFTNRGWDVNLGWHVQGL